jgi:hypothetical protein
VVVPLIHKVTPLRSLSHVAHDQVMLFCILTITISIKEIPATKITGLNTIAMRFFRLSKSPRNHDPHFPTLNTCDKTRNGDPMINIHSRPILIMFAIKRRRSAIVNEAKRKNLRAKPRVSGTIFLVFSVVR